MSSNWEWQETLAAFKDDVEAWTLEHPSLVVATLVVVVLSTLLWICFRKRNKGNFINCIACYSQPQNVVFSVHTCSLEMHLQLHVCITITYLAKVVDTNSPISST